MAASTVCASYDLIGRMALFDKIDTKVEDEVLAIFLLEHWSDSIVRTYENLESFLRYRREGNGDAYMGYTWLYERAFPHSIRCKQGHPQIAIG